MIYSVALVVDPKFGNRVAELSLQLHTWLVDSPANRAAAQAIWASKSPIECYTLESGVTIFTPIGVTPEDWCVNIMDSIEDHHNRYAHEPGYTVLEVYGVAHSERIRISFTELGFTKFINTAEGFHAEKTLP